MINLSSEVRKFNFFDEEIFEDNNSYDENKEKTINKNIIKKYI